MDSDWAGCLRTRKSTSGGVLSIAGTAMKSWSSTQGSVATSVAEAEYYAALKGAAEALGFASLARDLGYELKVILWSDSTAARGVAATKGLSSRTRHMEVKFLWLQGALAKGAAGLEKGAHERQPCRCSHKAHSSRRNEKVNSIQSSRTNPCRLGPRRGVGESTL